jgi:hypothetical protein
MPNSNEPPNIDKIYMKAIYWGMLLDFFVPAILVALGFLLRSKVVGFLPTEHLKLLLAILLVASLVELGVLYFLKRKLFWGLVSQLPTSVNFEQCFVRFSIVLFLVALVPSVYGFVYLLLGGTMDWFLIFVAITLLCFMLFKPKTKEIEKLSQQYHCAGSGL